LPARDRGSYHAFHIHNNDAIAGLLIDSMKALCRTAVVNGVLAAPLTAVMMLISSNPRIMGRLAIGWKLRVIGWFATAVMATASAGLFVT
jgi:Mn2+/Fe2+ NRAMP family transporter